jgi:4-aminobutyrate aminotransferase-like enzyme
VVHLVNSGAEAADVAMLMAQLYTGNHAILALRTAYHGIHSAAMALTGINLFKQPIPPMPGVYHVANPDPYRGIFGDDVDEYVAEIDRTIRAERHLELGVHSRVHGHVLVGGERVGSRA